MRGPPNFYTGYAGCSGSNNNDIRAPYPRYQPLKRQESVRPRPSTPARTLKELRSSVFSGSQDHFSFRKVVGRHGALIAELGAILHKSANHPNGAFVMQAALQQLYQRLAKLNAMWIRLICVPDDSIFGGTERETTYRNTVAGMIDIFSNRIISMLTDKEGEMDRDPPFGELLNTEARFFCTLSKKGRKKDAYNETHKQLVQYVVCLERAWDAIKESGVDTESHYVTAADCITAGMGLGAWLDSVVK